MGAVASYTRDAGLQRLAFSAPPCGYAATQCEVITAADGAAVALRFFHPAARQTIPATVNEAQQRWRARQKYEDERMLCLFSHGNSDDLGTSAPYSQWLADAFNMNVVAYDYPVRVLCFRASCPKTPTLPKDPEPPPTHTRRATASRRPA